MKKVVLVFSLLLTAILPAIAALAHEGREVGLYVIEFGWRIEPAYAGVFNGPELTISEHDTDKPVEGVADTLKLAISFGDQTKTLRLRAVPNSPGHYTADLIPTRPGDYTFHLTGKIGDTAIDETFSSADGEFDSVEPASDLLFPDTNVSLVDLQAQIDELKAAVEALKTK